MRRLAFLCHNVLYVMWHTCHMLGPAPNCSADLFNRDPEGGESGFSYNRPTSSQETIPNVQMDCVYDLRHSPDKSVEGIVNNRRR